MSQQLRRLLPRLQRALRVGDGPVVLPAHLDGLAERWWSLPPKLRTAAVATLVVAALTLPAARLARSPWGPPVRVLVAARDLEAGQVLVGADVRSVAWPGALAPADPLAEAAGRVRGYVPAGSVLTERHVATDLQALLAVGEVAVPVPRELADTVAPGEQVDLLVAGFDGSGTLAGSGRVSARDRDWVWIAVARERAAMVAAAALDARLVIAVRAGRYPPAANRP